MANIPSSSFLLQGDKSLPQSLEAEKAILSCLLIDPGSTMDTVFSKITSEAYFHDASHRKIFTCLNEMRQEVPARHIDFTIIYDRMERGGILAEIGGQEYLYYLLNIVPTTANIETYISYVVNMHILRSLIAGCNEIIARCYETNEHVPELLDSFERKILEITQLHTDINFQKIGDLMEDTIHYLEDISSGKPDVIGLQTGFDFDEKIMGLKPGELIVLAARPSIGKTALAMDIARNLSVEQGKTVGVFSLEMNCQQIVLRLLCGQAMVNIKDIRDGRISASRWEKTIMSAANLLSSAPIYIDDTPQLTSLELRQKARRLKRDHNVELIIIDYLQLMRCTSGNKESSRENDVARISSDVKSLAKELKIPVLLLCQLNRQAEQTNLPKLSHLRESGAIEQDADIVMILHREREVDLTLKEHHRRGEEGVEAKLIIAKNRNGETGIVELSFKPGYTRFFNSTVSSISDADIPPDTPF